jgi:hypothetical protein
VDEAIIFLWNSFLVYLVNQLAIGVSQLPNTVRTVLFQTTEFYQNKEINVFVGKNLLKMNKEIVSGKMKPNLLLPK